MISAEDRIKKIREQGTATGIDFIYVYPDQVTLDIYFLESKPLSPVLPGSLPPDKILIYSPEAELPIIEVGQIVAWVVINSQHVLRLKTKAHGDFTLYKFKIDDARIDPYFNDIRFSFKANCPSDLDCKPPAHECPPDEVVDFPVDYLARDFWSYRKALLDFASLRYPQWNDRLEADAGIMMVELLSALGDEMSYYQDRVSREAYLETATQRRSVRRHARLVDYNMHDGLGATAWLDFTVNPAAGPVTIPFGTSVFVPSDTHVKINFEVGPGIMKLSTSIPPLVPPLVNGIRNEFTPHQWDEDQTCLSVGTTGLFLDGHHQADLPFDDFQHKVPGKWVLIKTTPVSADQHARAQVVRLIEIKDTIDPVLNRKITHIVWEKEQGLQYEFELGILSVRGNIVIATAGSTNSCFFIVNKNASKLVPAQLTSMEALNALPTIERAGHDGTLSHLFTLPNPESVPLVFLGKRAETAEPEITLQQYNFDGTNWVKDIFWPCRRSLLGVNASKPDEPNFMLDDGTWQRVVGYQRAGEEFEHADYAFNNGATIRFGDEEFGRTPGENTLFKVIYRLGGGRKSNVSANSLTKTALTDLPVTNPLPSTGGHDEETTTELRQLAPEAFRAITYRAVRPEDYAEAAERLPWVQKAGASFRWTGSWLTAFVTPDPRGKVVLEEIERAELLQQLNRFRQAGRAVYVMDPEYANMDLDIHLCIAPDSYPGQVKERVFEALMGKKGIRARQGYFSPDRFTFGTFLLRSTLEAAIQAVPGVRAVEQIYFRRRGWFRWTEFSALSYDPGKHVIIRIENDPLHPERGSLKIHTHGGL